MTHSMNDFTCYPMRRLDFFPVDRLREMAKSTGDLRDCPDTFEMLENRLSMYCPYEIHDVLSVNPHDEDPDGFLITMLCSDMYNKPEIGFFKVAMGIPYDGDCLLDLYRYNIHGKRVDIRDTEPSLTLSDDELLHHGESFNWWTKFKYIHGTPVESV